MGRAPLPVKNRAISTHLRGGFVRARGARRLAPRHFLKMQRQGRWPNTSAGRLRLRVGRRLRAQLTEPGEAAIPGVHQCRINSWIALAEIELVAEVLGLE